MNLSALSPLEQAVPAARSGARDIAPPVLLPIGARSPCTWHTAPSMADSALPPLAQIHCGTESPCVFIVDENALGRASLAGRLATAGFSCEEIVSPLTLASCFVTEPSCIVMVQRAKGDGYADLLRERRRLQWTTEIIVLSAEANIELAVQAMRLGAYHVYDLNVVADDELSVAIRGAIAAEIANRERLGRRRDIGRAFASLSSRERDVLHLVVAGEPNKVIAKQLGVSIRTIEDRRRHLYHKLGVESAVQLVTLVHEFEGSRDAAADPGHDRPLL